MQRDYRREYNELLLSIVWDQDKLLEWLRCVYRVGKKERFGRRTWMPASMVVDGFRAFNMFTEIPETKVDAPYSSKSEDIAQACREYIESYVCGNSELESPLKIDVAQGVYISHSIENKKVAVAIANHLKQELGIDVILGSELYEVDSEILHFIYEWFTDADMEESEEEMLKLVMAKVVSHLMSQAKTVLFLNPPLDINDDLTKPSPLFLLEVLVASKCIGKELSSVDDLLTFAKDLPTINNLEQLTQLK